MILMKPIVVICLVAMTVLSSQLQSYDLDKTRDGHLTLGSALTMALLRNWPIGADPNIYFEYLKADNNVAFFDRTDSIFERPHPVDTPPNLTSFGLRWDLPGWPTLTIFAALGRVIYMNLFDKAANLSHVHACLDTAEAILGRPTFQHFDTVTAMDGGAGAMDVDDYRWWKDNSLVSISFRRSDSMLVLTVIDTVYARNLNPDPRKPVGPENWNRFREYRSH
jgi:hypothetical protein